MHKEGRCKVENEIISVKGHHKPQPIFKVFHSYVYLLLQRLQKQVLMEDDNVSCTQCYVSGNRL